MKILMIGNGFDLEHGLPTKYTHFLDYIIDFRNDYRMTYNSGSDSRSIKYSNRYFEELFTDSKKHHKVIALQTFTKGNLWIDYFIKVRERHLKEKENWIDFESEISRIVQNLDRLRALGNSNTVGPEYYQCRDMLREILDEQSLEKSKQKDTIAMLKQELNKLICALEIYLDDYVGQQKINWYNPDIASIHPDNVISFNYTDTFRKIYAEDNENIGISFVHGMAANHIQRFRVRLRRKGDTQTSRIESTIERNNMVLGIDEYLTKERRRKETDFIEFKKYYQRIYKKTGNEYKKWLTADEPKTLYIFGHSLDVTDGDLLREFMERPDVKTMIFYKNKKQLGQQIANLVKILGDDMVIEKAYGDNPSIVFQQQSDTEPIENSRFDLIRDIGKLNRLYELKEKEARDLLSKIDDKIANQDFEYFGSQVEVVDLFDALQRIGLGSKYDTQLYGIATAMVEDCGCEAKMLNAEDWSYGDYDSTFGPSGEIVAFIKSVNSFNLLYENGHMDEEPEKDIFSKYNYLLRGDEEVEEVGLQIIWADFRNAFADEEYDQKKLWGFLEEIVLRSARKCAKSVLCKLRNSTDDSIEIVRIERLLHELEAEEYLTK